MKTEISFIPHTVPSVQPEPPYAYGVRWDSVADTYTKGVVINGHFVPTNYDMYPIQSQMKRCTLLDTGQENYFLDDNDSTLKADGVTPSNLDGADGQVVVKIPAFHFIQKFDGVKRYELVGNGPFHLIVSDGSIVNSTWHPAFLKGSLVPQTRYIGAYNAGESGGKLLSVSGVGPKVSATRSQFQVFATARGAGWTQLDAWLYAATQLLFVTEYGTYKSQAAIGAGRTTLSGGTWEVGSYLVASGLSNSIGNASGNVSIGGTGGYLTDFMSYRGIEHWFGHIWQFMHGININNDAVSSKLYLSPSDPSVFADNTAVGYEYMGDLAAVDGYVKKMMDVPGFWPSVVGGSSATFLADYYYTYFDDDPSVGWRVARVGGSADFGAAAGAFYVNSNHGSTYSNASVGGRLCF